MEMMQKELELLQGEVRRLSLQKSANPTGIPFITACRFTGPTVRMPETDNPYLYIVLDGSLRLHTPSGILDYVAGQYSLSKIDTPLFGTVLTQSVQQDFLALSVEFTPGEVIAAILDLDNDLTEKILAETLPEETKSQSDQAVLASLRRFFTAARQDMLSDFLRRNILQELFYYLLCGSCGRQFIESIAAITQTGEIYEANSWIKENFRSPFTVEDLARQQNMSVSLFHQKFKRAVGMGPLQCQKRLRLTEARRLMLDEGCNVTEASAEVGYESLSQFIRDYRKMFGFSPKEDILRMQGPLKK